jgi:hypothetical protein
MAFSVSTFAAEPTNTKKVDILEPASASEKVFTKVEMVTLPDGTEQVKIKGRQNAGQAAQTFDVKIDKNNKTYTATKMKGEELQQTLDTINKRQAAKKSSINTLATNMFAGVIATIDDPVGADLCETGQELTWNS